MLARLMFDSLRRHPWAVGTLILFQVVQTAGTLLLPAINADVVDRGIVEGDLALISQRGAVMLWIAAGQVVAALAAGWIGSQVAAKVASRLRSGLFSALQGLSPQQTAALGPASLVTRSTTDVQQLQGFTLLLLTMMGAAPLIGVGGLVMALVQDVALSIVMVVVVPVLGLIMVFIVRRLVPLYRAGQDLLDANSRVLGEQVSGAAVIRSFGRQHSERMRYGLINAQLTKNNLSSALLIAAMLPLLMLVVNLSTVVVVWCGGQRIASGDLNIGSLIAFIAYLLQILLAIMMLMYVLSAAPRAAACAERISEVRSRVAEQRLRNTHHGKGGTACWDASAGSGAPGLSLDFHDVGFAFAGAQHPVLGGLTFSVPAGSTTAVVGSTGSGKSTLLRLLPRLLELTEGKMSLGGCDITGLDTATLRTAMSLVPQQAFLFAGTIASNLRMAAPDATDCELWSALEAAQADSFVRDLPMGLLAPVDSGGANFSGGQRQRLCIARAILRRCPLYLFDDSFSALDAVTERAVQDALRDRLRGATVLMVSERLAGVRHADWVLVLDGGHLVGQGTHASLARDSAVYREIASSQLALTDAP